MIRNYPQSEIIRIKHSEEPIIITELLFFCRPKQDLYLLLIVQAAHMQPVITYLLGTVIWGRFVGKTTTHL